MIRMKGCSVEKKTLNKDIFQPIDFVPIFYRKDKSSRRQNPIIGQGDGQHDLEENAQQKKCQEFRKKKIIKHTIMTHAQSSFNHARERL